MNKSGKPRKGGFRGPGRTKSMPDSSKFKGRRPAKGKGQKAKKRMLAKKKLSISNQERQVSFRGKKRSRNIK